MKLLICLLFLSVLGLSVTAPRRFYGESSPRWRKRRKLSVIGGDEDDAKSQIEPITTTLVSTVALPLALKLGQCALCDGGCPSVAELQSDTDQKKEAARLMAAMDVLESVNKLKDLKRSLMKDNEMAKAEVLDLLSSAIDGVGGLAKGIICKK